MKKLNKTLLNRGLIVKAKRSKSKSLVKKTWSRT